MRRKIKIDILKETHIISVYSNRVRSFLQS